MHYEASNEVVATSLMTVESEQGNLPLCARGYRPCLQRIDFQIITTEQETRDSLRSRTVASRGDISHREFITATSRFCLFRCSTGGVRASEKKRKEEKREIIKPRLASHLRRTVLRGGYLDMVERIRVRCTHFICSPTGSQNSCK